MIFKMVSKHCFVYIQHICIYVVYSIFRFLLLNGEYWLIDANIDS